MDLYIDIANKTLVTSLTSNKSVSTPSFMQGDSEPLAIHLLETGTDTLYQEKYLDTQADTLKVAIARFGKGTLTYAYTYALNDENIAEIVLPLNTTSISSAVGENESISAYIEVQLSSTDGTIITILQTSCTIKSQLIEDSPAIELEEAYYSKEQVELLIENVKTSVFESLKLQAYDVEGNAIADSSVVIKANIINDVPTLVLL